MKRWMQMAIVLTAVSATAGGAITGDRASARQSRNVPRTSTGHSAAGNQVTLGAEAFLGSGTIVGVEWEKNLYEEKPVSVRYLARDARGGGESLARSRWFECPHDDSGTPCPGLPVSFSHVAEGDAPGQQEDAGRPAVPVLHFIEVEVAPQGANAHYQMRIEVTLRRRP